VERAQWRDLLLAGSLHYQVVRLYSLCKEAKSLNRKGRQEAAKDAKTSSAPKPAVGTAGLSTALAALCSGRDDRVVVS